VDWLCWKDRLGLDVRLYKINVDKDLKDEIQKDKLFNINKVIIDILNGNKTKFSCNSSIDT